MTKSGKQEDCHVGISCRKNETPGSEVSKNRIGAGDLVNGRTERTKKNEQVSIWLLGTLSVSTHCQSVAMFSVMGRRTLKPT